MGMSKTTVRLIVTLFCAEVFAKINRASHHRHLADSVKIVNTTEDREGQLVFPYD